MLDNNRKPNHSEHDKDILLIAVGQPCGITQRVYRLLSAKGIKATIVSPTFVKPLDFEFFSHLLSTHRFVAAIDNGMKLIINNFLIQNSIRKAEFLKLSVPDMWVQFGSNTGLMRELGLDAELIARRILQEFFVDDYRPISERKEKAVV